MSAYEPAARAEGTPAEEVIQVASFVRGTLRLPARSSRKPVARQPCGLGGESRVLTGRQPVRRRSESLFSAKRRNRATIPVFDDPSGMRSTYDPV